MRTPILVIQIISSVVLIVYILMQARGVGLSASFGGSDSSFYRAKRGLEKLIFIATIITAVIFSVSSLLLIIVR